MEASSVTRRLLGYAVVRDWAWWQLPPVLRAYVGVVPLAALGMIAFATSQTVWTAPDLLKFLLLLVCGMVSVAATPRVAYLKAGMTRDFLTVWVLPVAILLPPIYAMVIPIPLQVLTQSGLTPSPGSWPSPCARSWAAGVITSSSWARSS